MRGPAGTAGSRPLLLRMFALRGLLGRAHHDRVGDVRRGPERQAGAARPDLVNPAILPSAQPPEPIPCARDLDGLPASASLGQGHTVQPSTVTPTPWLPYVNHPGGAAARAGRSGTGALVAPARARYGL